MIPSLSRNPSHAEHYDPDDPLFDPEDDDLTDDGRPPYLPRFDDPSDYEVYEDDD